MLVPDDSKINCHKFELGMNNLITVDNIIKQRLKTDRQTNGRTHVDRQTDKQIDEH